MIYPYNGRGAKMDKGVFIAVFIFFGIISCASTNVPSVGELESLQLHEDEGRLWNRSTEEQRKIDHSGGYCHGYYLYIRYACQTCHGKCGNTHDGRHNLSAIGCCRLNSTCLRWGKTGLLH